jgi:hypothetical protein
MRTQNSLDEAKKRDDVLCNVANDWIIAFYSARKIEIKFETGAQHRQKLIFPNLFF